MADTPSPDMVKGLSQIKSGADLKAKRDQLKSNRSPLEGQWKVQMAFYQNKQYTYYNQALRRIESLPVEDGEKPRYRVRIINNQISPGVHALLAKLTKTKPVMHATGASGSDSDIKAAQVADKLLEHWWETFSLDDKLAEALLWAVITGNGYWKISWDDSAGSSMRFLLDPQGNPITDQPLEDMFRDQLTQQGITPQEQVIYMGDIKVEVPSPFDIYLDDTAKVFDDAKYAFCDHYMTPSEIKKRWKIDVSADSTAPSLASITPYGFMKSSEPTQKVVTIGYFVPSAELPNGRQVTFIDDKIVEDDSWRYPFNMLPLIKFPGIRIPGQVYDIGDVAAAIPIQKALNKTYSLAEEYKNLTLKPRVWAPTGSLQGVRLTTEPGVVYEYNPIGEHKPETEKLPSIPSYVYEHIDRLKDDLKTIFGLADISEGKPPPNVEAGIAIDLLQEMASDRIAPRILLLERCLGRAGNIMLAYAQEYYKEPRTLKIIGTGSSSKEKRFAQADLQGGVDITVETGSALPRTRAGRQQRIMDYVDRGFLRVDQAYKYLDIADLRGLAARFQADEDQAYREIEKIDAGQPINVIAMQNAIAAVQTGQPVGPDQQPITDPQSAQNYIKQESLQPLPFENLDA